MTVSVADLRLGDLVFERVMQPISRTTLALFAGASNDHNPIHFDLDAARAAGMDDVIGHGMLSMAYLARALTSVIDQRQLVHLSSRFAAVTHVHDVITCKGFVVTIEQETKGKLIHLRLEACSQTGEIKLTGKAIVRA